MGSNFPVLQYLYLSTPKEKLKPLFFFDKGPKENPLRHLEGAILAYRQDEKFVGKEIAIYTDRQISPYAINN